MNHLLKMLGLGFFYFMSTSLFAVEVMPIDPNSQDFDKGKCIRDATAACISEVCITSEQRDCQETCGKTARDKCK